MISRRTHPEGSDAARDNTLRQPGNETRLDARGEKASAGAATRADRSDSIDHDAGTRYVVPNAIDRDDD